MRRWDIKKQSDQTVSMLCRVLSCSHYFARILINRGIDTPDKAKAFLNTNRSSLSDPFLFCDMEAAVERIAAAIKAKEKITVYGDYDVDGITATALLVEVLTELGAVTDFYIPSRFTEGYGVNSAAVRRIAENGTRLIITVDTGITAVEEVKEAKALGVDVIVTDHHECQNQVPDTLILNPKRSGSGYPFADLAGVGVVYKLACALDRRYGVGDGERRYAPLAAIGTVADIMPMHGENRYIVSKGLQLLSRTESIGLRTLLDRCVGDRPIDTATIGFVIAPRINASGRMGSAADGVELLTTTDRQTAERLVDDLCHENNQRQGIENSILEEAVSMLENDPAESARNAIVLWGENWHNGVVGIVASRLKERYGKPCILFSIGEDFAKGSGRSVRPFNLFEALENISDQVEKFGGHAYAAGVLVDKNRLEEFRDAFCAEVDQFLLKNEFEESIEVDCVLREGDLSMEKVQELERLSPFGRGNETPIFCMRNVRLMDAVPTANGNHMRLSLMTGNQRITAFYFNNSKADFPYVSGDLVDVVFEADINTYNGRRSVQLSIKDVRCGSEKSNRYVKEFRRLESGVVRTADVPDREKMGLLYRFLYKRLTAGFASFDLYTLPELMQKEQATELSFGALYYSFKVLHELGVLTYRVCGSNILNVQIHAERRVELENSELLKSIQRKVGEPTCV